MLKVSEIFYSFQGEGLRMGRPSVFIRLFGCNLTCPGFSNSSLGDIPIHDITDVDQITGSQMSKGCDSRYSWHPEYKHLSLDYTPKELYAEMFRVIGNVPPLLTKKGAPIDIVFTGGEPMMQQKGISEFLIHCLANQVELEHVTIETNGTLAITSSFKSLHQELEREKGQDKPSILHFSISPKLPLTSGEPWDKSHTKFGASYGYTTRSFKYVVDPSVDTELTLKYIKESLKSFNANYRQGNVYLMPVGATVEQQNESLPHVAKLAVDNGYNVSVRAHLYAFGDGAGV